MSTLTLAIGPYAPQFGSWNWIADDIISALSDRWHILVFEDPQRPPPADVIVFLKFKPPASVLLRLSRTSRLVYLPVDMYSSCAEIEADRTSLRNVSLVVVHCQRLLRYFSPITRTAYCDHALRYITPEILPPRSNGCWLWIGRSCNMQPLVHWVNQLNLPTELCLVTEGGSQEHAALRRQFRTPRLVRILTWTPETHVKLLSEAIVALDPKDQDFRSRHKPPAKILDFLASGLPVAVNRGSSGAVHLIERGIPVRCLTQGGFCGDTLTDVLRVEIATQLRSQLSKRHVMNRFHQLLQTLINKCRV